MSNNEGEETTNLSPSGRRRKRTIISDSHPDIEAIIHDQDPKLSNVETDLSDKTHSNGEHGEENETDNHKDNVVISNNIDVNGVENAVFEDSHNDVQANTVQTAPDPIPTDIIYDETKPRRLPHPHKTLKHDNNRHSEHALRESISYLISPDEHEGRSGSTRRLENHLRSSGSDDEHYGDDTKTSISDECCDTTTYIHCPNSPNNTSNNQNLGHKTVEEIKKSHYDRSPETRRRKCSSPVQRLIVKNGQTAIAVAARGRERKSSLEARLQTLISPDYNRPRQRKISSDARLEHRPEDEQFIYPSSEPSRKRKVSFDTTTLINGNKIMPLNDGPKLSFQEEPEFYLEENAHNDITENETGARPKILSPPKIVFSGDEDEGFEPSDKDCSLLDKTNSDASEDTEEGYASGYDNKAYTADDEDSLAGIKAQTPPPTYLESTSEPLRRMSPASSPLSASKQNGVAVIPHTTMQSLSTIKKVSSSSLPTNFGRRNSEEVSTPKSILKVRATDGESLVSEDSIAGKTFKVRKDSIALFMDHNGEVAMQELRKEYRRPKCPGKDDVKRLWADRKNLIEKYKLHLLVLSLFLMTFAFVIVGLHFHNEHHKNAATSQKIFFEGKSRVLSLSDIDDDDVLTGKLGLGIPAWKHPTHCYSNYAQIYDKTCLRWKEHGRLEVAYFQINETTCYNVTWIMKPGTTPFDCYSLGSGYWYGPMNMTTSRWPLTSEKFSFKVNNAKQYGSGTFSTAVEYYWLSSSGQALIIDSNFPLEINWNWKQAGSVCIIGKKNGDFYYEKDFDVNNLHYTVCNGKNIVGTHTFIRKKFYPAVTSLPEKSVLEYPHWSSVWDSDNFELNQSTVQRIAEAVSENSFNCSSIEIDGKWEGKFGDLTFNRDAFDNMTRLVSTVKSAGCNLSLNIYPFFNFHSHLFQEGMNNHFFVRGIGGSVPALLRWQHGVGAMLDVSNPAAREWFTTKLHKIALNFDIYTFRLAYGTLAWIPHKPVFHKQDVNPNRVKQLFSDMVSGLGNVVIQSTSQSQHISTLLGIPSTIVNKNSQKCIRNILPDVFNLGLMGYPFIMSDGFSRDFKTHYGEALPSRDLFIRWMQLSAFLPALRYTVKPWSFDEEVVEVARNLTKFHSKDIISAIFKIKEKILDGEPIIKPLWWDQPGDTVTYTIDDQFIMADRFLVAPVLCEMDDKQQHLASRDIYIPHGVWKDMGSQKIILGPRWIGAYKVAQFDIPYFEKMAQYDQ